MNQQPKETLTPAQRTQHIQKLERYRTLLNKPSATALVKKMARSEIGRLNLLLNP